MKSAVQSEIMKTVKRKFHSKPRRLPRCDVIKYTSEAELSGKFPKNPFD